MPWPPFGTGGVNNVFKNLARCLREEKAYSTHVLVARSHAPGGEAEIGGVRVHRLDVWGPIDPRHPAKALVSFVFRLPHRFRSLRRIIAEGNIGVINPHFPGLNALTFVLMKKLRLFGGEVVLSFHGDDVKPVMRSRRFERLLWRWLLRNADSIVTVSNDLGADVLAVEPSVAEKLKTIYNGVDARLFSPRSEGPGPRPGPDRSGPIIVSIGQFEYRKGHDILVRAFASASTRLSEARLLLIGQNGPDLDSLRALIAGLGLADRVELHCDVAHEEVARYLTTATLYASASRSEGFGLAIVEAGATRIPVVCTRAHGQRELITDGVTGRLVEVDDAPALAEAIVGLLLNPEEARALAEKFHEEARTRFTWENTCVRYMSLVKRGVAPRASGK